MCVGRTSVLPGKEAQGSREEKKREGGLWPRNQKGRVRASPGAVGSRPGASLSGGAHSRGAEGPGRGAGKRRGLKARK